MSNHSWKPTCTLAALAQRAEILKRIRHFFDARGFLEVQTPVLSRDTVVDAHIDPIRVSPTALFGAPQNDSAGNWFLQTSPEFLMKRLVAAGAEAIYQIGPVFRAGEMGAHHNPEFTMAEWYRAGDSVESGIRLLCELATELLGGAPATVVTYRDLWHRHFSVDPLEIDIARLRDLAASQGHRAFAAEAERDDLLNLLFSLKIQPGLGDPNPIVVRDYPASQAALANLAPCDPRVAERFELFASGVELANGYGELRDAGEIEQRFHAANQARMRRGAFPLPTQSKLLSALPACRTPFSGCALGVDRLQMVLSGETTIAAVMPFPADIA